MKKNKIAVIYSTPNDPNFIDEYNNKILENTFNKSNIYIFPMINRKEYSLTKAYNVNIDLIKQSINNLDDLILLFIHDDISFLTKNWDKILLNNFNNSDYDILYVAGSQELMPNGVWWLNGSGKEMNTGKLRGKVWHTDGLKQWESIFYNSNKIIDEVVVGDGVFIAINPDNIIDDKWFDERFNGFHFYDISLSINQFTNGLKLGVMNNISILHKSVGEVNQEWENNRQQFCEIYKDELPIILGEDRSKLNVLICCQFFANYTGSEMSNYELARELVKQDCNVSIISTVIGDPLLSKAKKAGIKVYDIQEIVNLQYHKFDIIHINHKPIGEVVLQYFPNTPAVMHIRSEVIPVFEEPILHNNIKKYISIRPSITEYIKSFGINENDIVQIDNPFDTSRFNVKYKQQKNNKEIILFIGTLDYLRKQILFDLKQQVEKENKILWIIGSDNEGYSKELISNNVKYLGVKPDVENYLKKCDYTAGIFTGRSTIEGFLCGKKGYIYTVDKQGNILSKELMDVPNDVEKYSAEYSAKKVIELYNGVLNN